jgi:hypothetical protein
MTLLFAPSRTPELDSYGALVDPHPRPQVCTEPTKMQRLDGTQADAFVENRCA